MTTPSMGTLPLDDELERLCIAARDCPVENIVELGGDVHPQSVDGLALSHALCLKWARCAVDDKKGHIETLKVLLELRDDMCAARAQGTAGGLLTPLHWAAGKGHREIVKLLVELGGDVRAQDAEGDTPLHRAAGKGHEKIVNLLVELGGDTRAQDVHGSVTLYTSLRHSGCC